jgi:hypothetical protein
LISAAAPQGLPAAAERGLSKTPKRFEQKTEEI